MAFLVSLVRYGYTPLMLIGFNGLAVWLVASGYPLWSVGPLALAAVLLSFLVERIAPYEEEWNEDHHGDTSKDWAHGIVYEFSTLNSLLILPGLTLVVPNLGIWPTHLPLWAQLLVAIVVADAMMTLIHYYSHKVGWMWRLHQVHHGVHRLYGFNGFVRHPLHHTLDLTVGMAPLILAGLPFDVAVLLGFTVVIQLLVQHTNVDVVLGPFGRLLAVGPAHRLHHVHWDGEGDVNFGLYFTVWDQLLGTFRAEAPRAPVAGDIGITGEPRFTQSYLRQLILPFVKQNAGPEPGLRREPREPNGAPAE
ncbi:MAG: sterol desaturase family protein [Hyphomicrobiaceae bacterium]|nr:sterol desaturase family protein [Hyphomicrobiaceae bacterium]